MKKPIVSIIVPVYNVFDYVEECLQSIKNQTYEEFEVIIIDDGSTDDSLLKCQEFEKKDNRFKVYHQENKGLSQARNLGISKATGEYLLFVDSDDRIMPALLETVLPYLQSYDLVCFGVNQFHDQDGKEVKKSMTGKHNQCFSTRDAQINMIELNHVLTVAWNKIYKKQLFDHIRYPVNRFHEDEFTTYQLVGASNSIYFLEKHLYEYRIRPESIMNCLNEKRAYDLFAAMEEKSEYFAEDEELLAKVFLQYLTHIKYYKRVFQKEHSHSTFEVYCKEKYDGVLKKILKTKRVSYFEKGKAVFWKWALFK